jgi:hypothetical protein
MKVRARAVAMAVVEFVGLMVVVLLFLIVLSRGQILHGSIF